MQVFSLTVNVPFPSRLFLAVSNSFLNSVLLLSSGGFYCFASSCCFRQKDVRALRMEFRVAMEAAWYCFPSTTRPSL